MACAVGAVLLDPAVPPAQPGLQAQPVQPVRPAQPAQPAQPARRASRARPVPEAQRRSMPWSRGVRSLGSTRCTSVERDGRSLARRRVSVVLPRRPDESGQHRAPGDGRVGNSLGFDLLAYWFKGGTTPCTAAQYHVRTYQFAGRRHSLLCRTTSRSWSRPHRATTVKRASPCARPLPLIRLPNTNVARGSRK